MASIPWPEDLCNGQVTWWLGYMIADNYEDDDRYPQLKAGAGIKVNFSPDVAQAVRYNGVTGNKTIMPLVSSGVIGDDGYLYTENEDGSAGELGVILPSSECDTLTPRDWTWTVTVTENRIRINRFSISLSPGETIDLADYAPIDSSGGTHIVTETETAERAEKAASQAGQFRQETKTDREATQRLRNEAESFRNAASSSATSSAQSATSAAEILSDVQAHGITVDTSVGTRVYVGDTMIYGDTGWRDISDLLHEDWQVHPLDGRFRIKRENRTATLDVRIERTEGSPTVQISGNVINLLNTAYSSLPSGFLPDTSLSGYAYAGTRSGYALEFHAAGNSQNLRVRSRGAADVNWSPGDSLSIQATWTTTSYWPTSLPGLPE